MSSEDIAEDVSKAFKDDECTQVEELIASSADVNQLDVEETRSSLQHVSETECKRCLTLPVDCGADIKATVMMDLRSTEFKRLHGADIGESVTNGKK